MPNKTHRWELAAEAIVVKIRWFGLVLGYLYANTSPDVDHRLLLNAILGLGAAYTAIDTFSSMSGRVFLGRFPLLVSGMESLFIGLLCYYKGGLDNSFRFYYLLSLICCAIRHSVRVTYITFALHCLSVAVLYLAMPRERREPFEFLLSILLLAWVAWAASALALLLKRVSIDLGKLNQALRENQTQLEERITERTRELQEAQAQLWHQEKMAAFGLLAAGIAHEVGNPLASISTIVQVLGRREQDAYTLEKLALVSEQLRRIQGTLRELINFSRPASSERTRLSLVEVVNEALGIAKYYPGMKTRSIALDLADDLPVISGVRDQMVAVFLNLILNAIDATPKAGQIAISARTDRDLVTISVHDNGHGIAPDHRERLFEPYFTTKKHGTGLGLFMVRRIMRQHGGDIVCQSSPGEGTTFLMSLPALAEVPKPMSLPVG